MKLATLNIILTGLVIGAVVVLFILGTGTTVSPVTAAPVSKYMPYHSENPKVL